MLSYRYSYFVLIVMLALFITACGKQPDLNVQHDNPIVENSVKTWRSVDIAADMIFNIFGDLYKEGKITEEQKDSLIKIGDGIHVALDTSQVAITNYMWSLQINENVEDKKDQVINSLVILAKTFYDLRNEAADLYKLATGKEIIIPDVFMFNTVINALMTEE